MKIEISYTRYNLLKFSPVEAPLTYRQLADYGSSAPTVLQRHIGQIAVGMITEIEHRMATPAFQFLQLTHRTLKSN